MRMGMVGLLLEVEYTGSRKRCASLVAWLERKWRRKPYGREGNPGAIRNKMTLLTTGNTEQRICGTGCTSEGLGWVTRKDTGTGDNGQGSIVSEGEAQ